MASGIIAQADVARGNTARMRRGTEAMWQGRGWRIWCGHVAGGHAGPRGCPCGRGSAGEGPTG